MQRCRPALVKAKSGLAGRRSTEPGVWPVCAESLDRAVKPPEPEQPSRDGAAGERRQKDGCNRPGRGEQGDCEKEGQSKGKEGLPCTAPDESRGPRRRKWVDRLIERDRTGRKGFDRRGPNLEPD